MAIDIRRNGHQPVPRRASGGHAGQRLVDRAQVPRRAPVRAQLALHAPAIAPPRARRSRSSGSIRCGTPPTGVRSRSSSAPSGPSASSSCRGCPRWTTAAWWSPPCAPCSPPSANRRPAAAEELPALWPEAPRSRRTGKPGGTFSSEMRRRTEGRTAQLGLDQRPVLDPRGHASRRQHPRQLLEDAAPQVGVERGERQRAHQRRPFAPPRWSCRFSPSRRRPAGAGRRTARETASPGQGRSPAPPGRRRASCGPAPRRSRLPVRPRARRRARRPERPRGRAYHTALREVGRTAPTCRWATKARRKRSRSPPRADSCEPSEPNRGSRCRRPSRPRTMSRPGGRCEPRAARARSAAPDLPARDGRGRP